MRGMASDRLVVKDERTGKSYVLPIENGAVRATDLGQIKTSSDDVGLTVYDPGLIYTAVCTSKVTSIDGAEGVLRYRGYSIEELAEKSTYLETAYLIVKGELPDARHLAMWTHNITIHTLVHENIKKFMDGFRYDAHPMGMLAGTLGAAAPLVSSLEDELEAVARALDSERR